MKLDQFAQNLDDEGIPYLEAIGSQVQGKLKKRLLTVWRKRHHEWDIGRMAEELKIPTMAACVLYFQLIEDGRVPDTFFWGEDST